ncbi:hypothetical protein A2U01_0080289, partial [Trifolium medium]|nr:hypothetical protein [Trifolium medium]
MEGRGGKEETRYGGGVEG